MFPATLGIEGDMGWLLRRSQRHIKMLRFWNRLMQMSDNRLTKQVFVWEYCNGNKNWCSDVLQIFKSLDAEFIYENFMKCDLKLAEQQLRNLENNVWKTSVPKKPKLRFYREFKQEKKPELYVTMNLSRNERSRLAQLRYSILPLEIEVGRYRQKQVCDRLCPFCENEVEDEIHFLLTCSTYRDIRKGIVNFSELGTSSELEVVNFFNES